MILRWLHWLSQQYDKRWVANAFWFSSLLPLAWLWILSRSHRRIDSAWWWLALAFGISWIPDAPIDHMSHALDWVLVAVYPVAQTAIVGKVLLSQTRATRFLFLLGAAAIVSIVWEGVGGPEVILPTVAWLLIAGIAWTHETIPHLLRVSLVVYFCLGWGAWLLHAEAIKERQDMLATYYAYQLTLLLGRVVFCIAAWRDSPKPLQLVR